MIFAEIQQRVYKVANNINSLSNFILYVFSPKTEELFHPYFEFFMKIDACLKRIRDFSDPTKDTQDKMFTAYLHVSISIIFY